MSHIDFSTCPSHADYFLDLLQVMYWAPIMTPKASDARNWSFRCAFCQLQDGPPKKCARKCSYSQSRLLSRAVIAASQTVYIYFGEKKEHLLVYKNVAVLHVSIAIGTASARSWAGLMLMQFHRKASVCCNQTKTVPVNLQIVPSFVDLHSIISTLSPFRLWYAALKTPPVVLSCGWCPIWFG